jgi:phage virion morphogenesis protein
MAGVIKKIDLVTPDLRERAARLKNTAPLLKRIGVYVSRNAVPANFRNQASPDGTPWKPLAAQTISLRRGKHQGKGSGSAPKKFSGKILQDTGRLKASFTSEVRGNAVAVGTNVAYAARHQFGFKGARGAQGFARGKASTPARPFLFDEQGNLSKEAEDEIQTLIEDYLLEGK